MIRFILNEKAVATDLPPGTLLLDYIRYHRHLTGTKIGCREGDCGACTVLMGELKGGEMVYASVTSCLTALANVQGKHIVTIEGLNPAGGEGAGNGLNPIQQAMSNEAATQCGFCTPGFVVSLAGFCLSETECGYDAALASINGNICRCTGYKSIERAAAKVAALMDEKGEKPALDFVADHNILPAYFKNIKARLLPLQPNGQGPRSANGSRFLGGGTDLYVQQPEAMAGANVVSLFSKKELKGIYREDNVCHVGGAATVTDILSSLIFQTHFPQLKKFVKLVSSTPIRNIATVGGNLVNASPIGDLTIFFLALNATVILSNGKTDRTIPLRNFYKGYKQLDKRPDEFIARLSFELPGAAAHFNFEKVCKRTHLDIASVNTAMKVEVKNGVMVDAGLSAGGVGPIPMYLENASDYLKGKEATEDVILEAIETAQTEIAPISDVRGSADYKRLLLSQLVKAHFIHFFPSLAIDKLI